MRTVRRDHTAWLAVLAVLLVATVWIAAGDRSTVSLRDPAQVSHTDRDTNGTLSPVDVTDAAVTPLLGMARTAEPRLTPLWILPGLVAALAALCLFRRQHLRPTLLAQRMLLRGSLADRAPPIASLA